MRFATRRFDSSGVGCLAAGVPRRPRGAAACAASTNFPIGRGSDIDGRKKSAGDTRSPSRIMELEMVARAGIEPATRGFSVARRARFGARKLKNWNEFSPCRPNRPARPSLLRTPGARPTEPSRKLKKRKGGGASRPSGDRTAALHQCLAWRLDQTDCERHQPPVRVFFTRAANSRWASACPSLTDHRSISSSSTTCCTATRIA